jgi:Uma2 family endonuclease
VVCGKPQVADSHVDTLLNPVLLVEVLSPGTEAYDRGKRATMYRTIPSLRELMFVAQESYNVQVYGRGPDGKWSSFAEAEGLDATIELTSIGYTLRLRELYGRLLEEV